MARPDSIYVTTHVGRDLLQSAALFRTDKVVVWEYASNSLQYIDLGTSPCVIITLDGNKKRIAIKDNGRGMDFAGLKNFFQMHGENLDRKAGVAGRGRFGTGKSAAFGIGDVLRVTTVRAGRRSRVELCRKDIASMAGGEQVPVRTLEREVPTSEPNGTLIEVEDIHLRSLDQAGIITYIERHLARWPRDVTVLVNNHQCEFSEPPVARTISFKPDGDARTTLGDVELVLKIAKGPLDESTRGVSIFTKGVWCETTLAGSEGREFSQYIFGEVDIPGLDNETGPILALDMSRSMRLNQSNPVVMAAYAFIGRHVEEVRRDLLAAERERRASEEAKKLQREADKIAAVLNQDFDEFRRRLGRAKAKAAGNGDIVGGLGGDGDTEILKPGGDTPGTVRAGKGGQGGSGNGTIGNEPESDTKGTPTGQKRGPRATPRGGFSVVFRHLGEQEHRARYEADERTILVNLDHPQIAAAKGLGTTEDIGFRRLAYEVAFAEYAVALASELERHGEYFDMSDPIVDIRDSINRLARRGASLYAAA